MGIADFNKLAQAFLEGRISNSEFVTRLITLLNSTDNPAVLVWIAEQLEAD